jgi:hypothetical protein
MRRAGLSLCSGTCEATAVCSSSHFLARSAFASAFWIEALAALTPAEAEIVRILLRATWPAPTAKTARTATPDTQKPDAAMTGK